MKDGVTIAWQNMPHIKDGWAYWQAVGDAEYARDQFNVIAQGSEIYEETGKKTNANFFIVGYQISSLPGWQEGAIAAALNVISRMAYPELKIPHLKNLPDTRLMVLNMGSVNLVFKSEGNQRSQNYAANLQNDLNMLAPGLSI